MKSSEALRKGMTRVKGQAFNNYYKPGIDTACAEGCIIIGLGFAKENFEDSLWVSSRLYELREVLYRYRLHFGVEIHKDNDEGMPLENIAQRLEAIGE
jgi:hypothetical protein